MQLVQNLPQKETIQLLKTTNLICNLADNRAQKINLVNFLVKNDYKIIYNQYCNVIYHPKKYHHCIIPYISHNSDTEFISALPETYADILVKNKLSIADVKKLTNKPTLSHKDIIIQKLNQFINVQTNLNLLSQEIETLKNKTLTIASNDYFIVSNIQQNKLSVYLLENKYFVLFELTIQGTITFQVYTVKDTILLNLDYQEDIPELLTAIADNNILAIVQLVESILKGTYNV